MSTNLLLNVASKIVRPHALIVVLILFAAHSSLTHMSHSIWHDEQDTFAVARAPDIRAITYRTIQSRPYPPLYFLIVNQTLKWRNDEFGLRLPSVVFGLLSIWSVYLLGRLLFDSWAGALGRC